MTILETMRGLLLPALVLASLLADGESMQPTVIQLLMEAIIDNPRLDWRDVLPDTTDNDNDGEISEREMEEKYNEYMNNVFNIFDLDGDGFVTAQELELMRIDMDGARSLVDMALESYPLKFYIRYVDQNENGFIDRTDFRLLQCGGRPRLGKGCHCNRTVLSHCFRLTIGDLPVSLQYLTEMVPVSCI